ncbi:hypothetical protein PVAND_003063 [Polypedilum vanderplanki]|uniref:Uncharacterized protein n=1 Tax=Polypedilum vanderplanki TaxID=319348 RepID=A0A9J6BTB9_POLVA|nr:hypothetical protein PVAND_003063 [Polypedilum vanderplanki]
MERTFRGGILFFTQNARDKVGVPWELIENYSKDSTIHGVKYVCGKKQHCCIKIFWIIIFAMSFYFCAQNIIEINKVREERPVMISIGKKLIPIFEIPFPAITICPEMKAKCNKINLTEIINRKSQNYSEEEMQNMLALNHVCESHLYDDNIKNITKNNKNIKQFDIIEKLNELSFRFDEMFFKCRFGEYEYKNCEKYFHKVITDVGICYTFNMLDHTDFINNNSMHMDLHKPAHGKKSCWSLNKDYDSMKVKVYPKRIINNGQQSGLSVIFKVNSSMLCSNCVFSPYGFRVTLHMPVELSSLSKQFYNIPFRRETNLIVKPNMIYASKDIKDYEPNSRQCYFSNEKKLKFYKIYSKANCELECKANFISRLCGCVKFSMPRSNETTVCNSAQLECVYQTELNYTTRDLQRKLLEKQLKKDIKQGKTNKNDERFEELEKLGSCNCLASCTNIKYDVEISQTDYDYFTEDDFLTAKLNVYFKDYYFSRLKRYEIYGWSDFLSNSGGTLGLFMGCSVLSFIEIIYHVIIYCINKIKSKMSSEIIPS